MDDARELAARLLLGIQRPGGDDVIDALVERSGAIPFLIHALAHRLDDAGTGPVSLGDVANTFADFLDDRDDSKAATHLVTRLDLHYGPRTPAAKSLLDGIATHGPARSSDLNSELLDDLIDDHYLVERRGLVSWRYPVLQEIWEHKRRLR